MYYTYLSDISKANLATGFIVTFEEHGRLYAATRSTFRMFEDIS